MTISSSCRTLYELTQDEYFWYYKAYLLFSRWAELLETNPQRSMKWLCHACETTADITHTGMGSRLNQHSTELFPQIEIEPTQLVHPLSDVSYIHSYVGDFVEGKYEGFGIFQPCDMIHQRQGKTLARQRSQRSHLFKHYVGEWKRGQHEGQGTCEWTNGRYCGEYLQGMRHGEGTYWWFANEARYDGQFKHNSMWGHGKFTWPDGFIDGDWKRNELHGECYISWQRAGSQFSGTYEHGMRKTGTYTWVDGSIFEGSWNGANREGLAKMTFANGLQYEGYYRNDVREGPGTLRWPNGDVFTGHWRDGRRWGYGTFEPASGASTEQYWEESVDVQYSVDGAARFP